MKYTLFDLEIETVGDPTIYNCSHVFGEGLLIKGENLYFKPGTKQFSHYALGALMPFIAAKQRATQETDWMFYETEIACPDPICGARFRFKRKGTVEHDYSPIH